MANDSLSMDGCHNPSWICEELRRREFVLLRHEGLKQNHLKEDASFLPLLKDCAKNKDIYKGMRLHADIMRRDLITKNPYLASTLISMYAKCGMLVKAQHVLEEIPIRDSVSWNALITGYAQKGLGHEALNCFERMQSEGLSPDAVTFICILKACGQIGAIEKGKQIHDEIVRRDLLEKDVVLGTALVDMYAKSGLLSKAYQVLKELPIRNVVSWNALIAGYSQQGQAHDAIMCFECMLSERIYPDLVTFTCILKACGSIGAIEKGKRIHDEIMSRDFLQKDIVIGNALVDMYAKCGLLTRAHQVLRELTLRDIVSWNALIAGYSDEGQGDEALKCFERIQCESLSPDPVTFICILKACGIVRSIEKGKQIHEQIVGGGFLEKESVLGTSLVDMYAKCGVLSEAQQVLENLTSRNVVCWNALVTGYAQEGHDYEALNCLERMQSEGVSPDSVTFICILRSCGSIGAIDKGKQIHDKIVSMGLLEKDIMLGNTLVDMYAKCGLLTKAHEVLLELPVRDIVSWNALISGYVQHRRDHEALESFEKMQSDGLSPDEVTFTCILKSCGSTGAIDKGKQIHENIVGKGLLEKDTGLGNALVDMYAKCGMLSKAHELLEELLVRSVVSWCALISGHVQQGHYNVALNCFEQMQREGFSLDPITCICILNACANTGDIDKGKQIHDDIVTRGLMENDIVIGTALVDMYAKCGAPTDAEKILQGLPIRDIVCWNALICAYAQQGRCQEALNCFECMRNEFIDPDAVTFISILNACASMGAINKGKQIHEEIVNRSLLKDDIMLGNALVDMYAKCGELAKASNMLDELPSRDVITWNALIAGYSQKGRGREALDCIECMQSEGLFPDEVTCLCVLSACSHRGLLDEAQTVFANMTKKYGIAPMLEHHTCMLLVLGCAGHFDEAVSVIKVMPSSDYPAVWLTLLSGCRKWGNVKLGGLAFDQVVQLDSSYAAAYILMADIFRAAGMQKDAENVEMMRLKYGHTANGITHIFDGS